MERAKVEGGRGKEGGVIKCRSTRKDGRIQGLRQIPLSIS